MKVTEIVSVLQLIKGMTSQSDALNAAKQKLAEVGEIIGSLPPDSEAFRLAMRALEFLREYLQENEKAVAAERRDRTGNLRD